APGFLVHVWRLETNLPARSSQHQIAIVGNLQIVGAVELQLNLVRVCTRCNRKVVLDMPLVSIEVKIDSRVKAGIAYAPKLRNVSQPAGAVISNEIVRTTGQFL